MKFCHYQIPYEICVSANISSLRGALCLFCFISCPKNGRGDRDKVGEGETGVGWVFFACEMV